MEWTSTTRLDLQPCREPLQEQVAAMLNQISPTQGKA
jgi:hypothetical protein